MLKYFTSIFLLLTIASFSSASTSNPVSGFLSNSQPRSNLSRTVQKSSIFCSSNHDCWASDLGSYSTCVDSYCTCDFGYKLDDSTEKCSKIQCDANYDCSWYFSNSKCDLTGSCACSSNSIKNETLAKCIKKECTADAECPRSFSKCDTASNKCVCKSGYEQDALTRSCTIKKECTYSSDCSVLHSTCDQFSRCVCSSGYNKNAYGNCVLTYHFSWRNTLPTVFGAVGGVFLLSFIIGFICVYRRRRMARAGRVIHSPVQRPAPAAIVAPGTGYQSQPGQPGPPGFVFQPHYQPTQAIYAEPYENAQQQNLPTQLAHNPQFAATYSQASHTDVQLHPQASTYYPTNSKIQF